MRDAIQLYTLREQCASDLPGVIARLGRIGYAAVELAGLHGHAPDDVRAMVDGAGMVVAAGHAMASDERALDDLQAIGSPYAVVPGIARDHFDDADGVKRGAEVLNGWLDAVRSRGMRLAYHNHFWEFAHEVGGMPAFDAFVDLLDPEIAIELDIYWAQTAGADPAALAARLGDRCRLLHVKDGPCTLADPMTAVGDGKVDVATVLTAATAAEWPIVELDRYDGDMWDAVERSHAYLDAR